MRTVIVIDTCIFLNVLDVPGFNQDRIEILGELQTLAYDENVNLLLPVAAIIETGNHIAQLSDGRLRRKYAEEFAKRVLEAVNGDAPWTPTPGIEIATVSQWMQNFSDHAMRGLGIGDISILEEFHSACKRHPHFRVRIWTTDGHLGGYDRPATKIGIFE